MGSFEVALDIIGEIENALDLGYGRIYVNVDDLENGLGFLRVLAMKKSEYLIVFEGSFVLDECYRILDLLDSSEYDIVDFTTKWNY